ncbi:MAG TPA: HAMP domain-containing sensor histidine kinase, partial [Coleofasciculaceae cyanobacterium]
KDEISPSNLERTIRYAIRQKQIQTTLKDTTAVLERQVEHLRQIQTRLLPSVSHEFRTPLMTIQSSANLLEIDLANEEKRESRFQLIYDGIDRIVHTLDNSLVYAALEAGGLPFNASPMALPSFCQGLVADLQAFADDQQQIQFMRQGNSPSQVSLDPNLVQLILTHLLLNAIRYAPKSGIISLILTYQAAMSGAIVTFHIQDRGIGIPSIEQDKIFDAYYRASNANSIPGTPGIGLGLAIVKSAASLHGGTVALTSEVGVGTSFTVSLPVRER